MTATHRRRRGQAATAALVALPITLALSLPAAASTPAGLVPVPPAPVAAPPAAALPVATLPIAAPPVAALLPSPVNGTVTGLLGGPTASPSATADPSSSAAASPSASASASASADPVQQLLSGVVALLASPTAAPPGASAAGLPAPALPSIAVPVPSLSVAALTRTVTHALPVAVAHLGHLAPSPIASAGLPTDKTFAVEVLAARPPAAIVLPANISTGTAGAALAEPASDLTPAQVDAAAPTARAVRIAAARQRTTDQVSTGLAAVAFGCVALAAGGQVAARRRTSR